MEVNQSNNQVTTFETDTPTMKLPFGSRNVQNVNVFDIHDELNRYNMNFSDNKQIRDAQQNHLKVSLKIQKKAQRKRFIKFAYEMNKVLEPHFVQHSKRSRREVAVYNRCKKINQKVDHIVNGNCGLVLNKILFFLVH